MSKINIIAVDFDDTLSLGGYPDCGKPSAAGFSVLRNFRKRGGKLILWTCRTGEDLTAAVEFCRQYGLEFDAINENVEEQLESWRQYCARNNKECIVSPKIYADLYIDDKMPADINWTAIEKLIK